MLFFSAKRFNYFQKKINSTCSPFHSIQNIIDEQMKTFHMDHDRHFIDKYIRKIREVEKDPAKVSYFTCKLHSETYL